MNNVRWHAGLAAFALTAAVAAQQPAPGFRLFAPFGSTDSHLLDTNGVIVHTWPGTARPANSVYLEPDGTLIRAVDDVGGSGRGGIQRVAFDGTLLWDFSYPRTGQQPHHDFTVLPNGNVLMIVWDLMTVAEAVAAGRDPALLLPGMWPSWMPDALVEIRQTGPQTGEVVWEWHVMDHVIQDFDPTKPNFGVVADHPELLDINFPQFWAVLGEWNHCNFVAYDPVQDLIVLNSPNQGEFYLLDHSTTTAEAAGHSGGNFGKGGDFLYRWGNPQAYRRGTPADQKLFFQHGAYIIPEGIPGAGNVLIFNNRPGVSSGQDDYSSVVEVDLPASFAEPAAGQAYGPAGFAWEYVAPTPSSFYSRIVSNAVRLPNGNTLVCSGDQQWLFEVDPSGQMVWQAYPPTSGTIFNVGYYERYLWADAQTMSASTGGLVQFDLVAGTDHSSSGYLMMGTASGTVPGFRFGGLQIPVNLDGYTTAILSLAGGPALPTFVGPLDALGRGTADFGLPPIPALAGLTLHHAYVVFRGTALTLASNPVPLTFDP